MGQDCPIVHQRKKEEGSWRRDLRDGREMREAVHIRDRACLCGDSKLRKTSWSQIPEREVGCQV